jgi:hypothetical protein
MHLQCGGRAETLWRTVIGDTSLDREQPAAKALGDGFKDFVILRTAPYIDRVEGDDEILTRASVASMLKEMNCASEMPSMDDVDQFYQMHLKEELALKEGAPNSEHGAYITRLRELNHSALLFLEVGNLICIARRFFRTGRGLLGLGQPSCLQGDEIWLIKNSSVPLMLRPTGDGTYTFVGECYIQGFMHGEMLDDKWGLRGHIGPVNVV